jgi:hypothetical protein
MLWIKSYPSELGSTLWGEQDLELVAIFYDLRLEAGRQNRDGKIKFLNIAHLADLLHVSVEILEKKIKKLLSSSRIRIHRHGQEYILILCKWKQYQSFAPFEVDVQKGKKKGELDAKNGKQTKVNKTKLNIKSGDHTFNTKFEFMKIIKIIEEDLELEPETDNSRNERLFDFVLKCYRSLDPIREIDSIRELFKKNPGEVKERIKAGTSLTDQLYALFGKAAEYAGLKK